MIALLDDTRWASTKTVRLQQFNNCKLVLFMKRMYNVVNLRYEPRTMLQCTVILFCSCLLNWQHMGTDEQFGTHILI
jgi:hypothetical protein